jgi:FkbM family methyltransferase
MSSSEDPRPLHRRAGRTVLRGLRPLAMPFLNRLQSRMRGVVDESASARDLSERLERIEAHLREERVAREAAAQDLPGWLERVEAHLREERAAREAAAQDLSGRLERVEAQLRADSGLVAGLAGAVSAEQAGLLVRLERMLIVLDALRLDGAEALERLDGALRAAADGLGGRTDMVVRLLGERADALAVQLGQRTDMVARLLGERADALAGQLGERTDMVARLLDERADALAGQLGERTDMVARLLGERADALAGLVGGRTEALAGQLGERTDMVARLLSERADALTGLVGGRTEALLGRLALPLGEDVLVRMPEGYLLVPAEDIALIAAMLESGGRLEPGTVAVIQGLLREGDVVLDVGANLGLTVLPAARSVGATGRVIAVEPASRIAGLLRRSLAMNGLDARVELHRCAAGAEAGRAVLNMGPISGHSSLLGLPGAERTEEVEVRPLDALVAPGTRVRLAKVDVEGYEAEAWRGMRRIVAENPGLVLLVEFGPEHLRRAGTTPAAWMALFTGAGFRAFEVDEVDGVLRPVRPLEALGEVHSVNLVMLREAPDLYPGLRFA